jgi:hypothetical protein
MSYSKFRDDVLTLEHFLNIHPGLFGHIQNTGTKIDFGVGVGCCIKEHSHHAMPYAHNTHGCMPDVLNFVTEMTVFYDKYHLLLPESRTAFNKDISELHHRLSRTSVVVERDVDSVSRRMQAMQTHFTKWMEDPAHQNKHWKLHPSDDFKLLVSKSKIILSRMQHEVLTHKIFD